MRSDECLTRQRMMCFKYFEYQRGWGVVCFNRTRISICVFAIIANFNVCLLSAFCVFLSECETFLYEGSTKSCLRMPSDATHDGSRGLQRHYHKKFKKSRVELAN